jgi:D-glycero-D-manno-heptose 1,7-bisphosphate phosphatase
MAVTTRADESVRTGRRITHSRTNLGGGNEPARRALFLDKDGTLVEDVPYNVDPSRLRFMNGAVEGLRAICAAGYRLVIVSNQSGVARGYFAPGALAAVYERLRSMLAEAGIPLDGFYWCPHHPDGIVAGYAVHCACRKPQGGLILQAARELDLDVEASWMAGDILDDVEAGRRAGCRTALVNNGHETEWLLGPHRAPDVVVRDLRQLARALSPAEVGR